MVIGCKGVAQIKTKRLLILKVIQSKGQTKVLSFNRKEKRKKKRKKEKKNAMTLKFVPKEEKEGNHL